MSFAGEYGTIVRRMSHDITAVVEIALNYAAWNGVNEMNLAESTFSARGNIYDPRIEKGSWGGVRSYIELKAGGLPGQTSSVRVLDDDNKVRDALVQYDQRNSPATIIRVVPGSLDDYHVRFVGLLDSWQFLPGKVQLNFRTDDRRFRSTWPAWPYLREEWFQMALDKVGTYAGLAYGKHDSTGLGLTHGMVPTVPVWNDASSSWWSVNLGPADFIKDVYVDGVLQAYPTNYAKIYGSLAGGKTFTIIQFNGGFFPAADAVVTCDLYGYAAGGQSDFLGTEVITNPVDQIRHFLVNFAQDRSRGYAPTPWNTLADFIDGTSWDNAAAFATAHGLEGSRFIQDQQQVADTFREWCESFLIFRPFWSSEGKIKLAVLTGRWPGNWDGINDVVRREDDRGNSFQYSTDPENVTSKISVKYLYDSVDNKTLRSFDAQDPSVGEAEDSSLEMLWQPARQV